MANEDNKARTAGIDVDLTDRIVRNPYAAKRLWVVLGAMLKEYETRFGKLAIEGLRSGAASGAPAQSNGQQAGAPSSGTD